MLGNFALSEDALSFDDETELTESEPTSSQWGGVTAFTHTLGNGTMRSLVELSGTPKGGYKRWRPLGHKPPMKVPIRPIGDPVLPPFDMPGPGGVTGLIVDLDPVGLLATLSDGDTTSYCPDASGHGHHARQATSTKWPTLVTDVLNGFPILEADSGNADVLITDSVANPASGSSIYVVMRRTPATSVSGTYMSFDAGGTSASSRVWEDVSFPGLRWNNPADTDLDGGNLDTSVWYILNLTFSGGGTPTCNSYFNGVLENTFSPNIVINAVQVWQIGGEAANSGNSQFARGLWYNSVHTAKNRNLVTLSLRNRYGL